MLADYKISPANTTKIGGEWFNRILISNNIRGGSNVNDHIVSFIKQFLWDMYNILCGDTIRSIAPLGINNHGSDNPFINGSIYLVYNPCVLALWSGSEHLHILVPIKMTMQRFKQWMNVSPDIINILRWIYITMLMKLSRMN